MRVAAAKWRQVVLLLTPCCRRWPRRTPGQGTETCLGRDCQEIAAAAKPRRKQQLQMEISNCVEIPNSLGSSTRDSSGPLSASQARSEPCLATARDALYAVLLGIRFARCCSSQLQARASSFSSQQHQRQRPSMARPVERRSYGCAEVGRTDGQRRRKRPSGAHAMCYCC